MTDTQFLSAGSCHTTPLPQLCWRGPGAVSENRVRETTLLGGEVVDLSTRFPFSFLGKDLFSQISLTELTKQVHKHLRPCNRESSAAKDQLYSDAC